MKRLIVRVYRVLFQLSGSRPIAFGGALVYITALNLSLIYGLSILLKEALPTSGVLQLFHGAYLIITAVAMFGVNLMVSPSYGNIVVSDKRNKSNNTPLIVYSVVSMLLFMYTLLSDKLF